MTETALPVPPRAPPRADHVVADQSAVFAALADPETHGGRGPITRIDTHGAVVFLVGPDAYKVKRAVDFPFMDFSTLEKRRIACAGEITVNHANAPQLYLGILPVVRAGGRLCLGGPGEVVEWVVHMRRFDERQTLDRVAETSGLPPELVAELARVVATAHARAPRCAPNFDPVAAMETILADTAAAFAAAPDLFAPKEAEPLAAASRAALAACAPLLRRRGVAGQVRRCHGDLHLRNIAVIDGHPVLFDAIEFNPALATCDVLYDLAFLLMDLCARGLRVEANAVLNRYLWAVDADAAFEGLAALPLFLSARAGVRAMVGAAAAAPLTGDRRRAAVEEAQGYFRDAAAFLRPSPARLVAVGGLSGTGKSTLGASLAPGLGTPPGAVILRSDIIRKALAGVAETDRLPAVAYTPDATAAVYAQLRHRAALTLCADWSVIADAVHARPDERAAIATVAATAGASFAGLWLVAPMAVLEARVDCRRNDASDATADVVRQQGTYDLGRITWTTIDVSGGPGSALAAARTALSLQPESCRTETAGARALEHFPVSSNR